MKLTPGFDFIKVFYRAHGAKFDFFDKVEHTNQKSKHKMLEKFNHHRHHQIQNYLKQPCEFTPKQTTVDFLFDSPPELKITI